VTDIDEWTNQIHTGDAIEILKELPDNSIHMAMCSPPYWGMRDYGSEDQIGLEENLEDFIANIAALGDELQRVVRDDGSWWLNLGDRYGIQKNTSEHTRGAETTTQSKYSSVSADISPKTKLLMPHRVAIELIERGWIARNDAVWQKTNPMPESVKDRLSTTFEFVFHFSKQKQYFYDLDAIREPYKTDLDKEPPIGGEKHQDNMNRTYSGNSPERTGKGKNPGDVFELATDNYSEGHFAVYPTELVEKPLKATCPPKVCGDCGTPYKRTEENEETNNFWTQACECETDVTEPGIVLDPMCGRGTTCKVAAEHGRRYIGIELNPEYAEMALEYVPDTMQQTLTNYD